MRKLLLLVLAVFTASVFSQVIFYGEGVTASDAVHAIDMGPKFEPVDAAADKTEGKTDKIMNLTLPERKSKPVRAKPHKARLGIVLLASTSRIHYLNPSG